MIALLLFLFLFIPHYALATVYWEEDFENHLYPNWDQPSCLTAGSPDGVACPYPQITTALAHGGTHSMWSHYVPDNQAGTFFDRSIPETTDLWTRQYARWDNFTFGAHNFKLFITGGPEGPVGVYWLHDRAGAELYPLVNHPSTVTCPSGFPDVTCNYEPNIASVPLNDNQWHCIETHQNNGTANTANGLVELYVDGTLTTRYTGLLMKTTSSGYNLIRPYAQFGDGDRYQDDWAVGNARIGCLGGGGGSTAGGGLDF